MCGPTGIGVLYGKYQLLEELDTMMVGGGMNSKFDNCGVIGYLYPPQKFEAGTQNIAGAIGLGKAIDYLNSIGMDNIQKYEKELHDYAIKRLNDIDIIAVTYGAGLIGALMVGVNFAKALAFSLNKPLIKVDHIKGHISANYLCFENLKPPFLCLLTSGAHTEILKVKDYTNYELIGSTLDDAVGECFDKVARVLNLEYPGGPKIEKLAKQGTANIIFVKENRELNHSYNFSYSGLKTAVINYIHTKTQKGEEINECDLCASFQKQAFDELIEKTIRASKMCGEEYSNIVIAGGVSANEYLRENLKRVGEENGLNVFFPKISLCTDNAAMIASCGYFNFVKGEPISDLTLSPKARIDL